ncbi:hypothetical protein Tco_1264410 [Tanacetum coccineum]
MLFTTLSSAAFWDIGHIDVCWSLMSLANPGISVAEWFLLCSDGSVQSHIQLCIPGSSLVNSNLPGASSHNPIVIYISSERGQNRLEVVLDLDVGHLQYLQQVFPEKFPSKKVLHQLTSRCSPHSLYPDNIVEFVVAMMQSQSITSIGGLLGKSTTRCNVARWKRLDNSLARNKLDRVPVHKSLEKVFK